MFKKLLLLQECHQCCQSKLIFHQIINSSFVLCKYCDIHIYVNVNFCSFKNTEFHEVGPSLNKAINDADGKIKYIAIKGAVLPLGKSLRSINNKDVTGVIQKLTLKEHVVARTSAGFW